MTMAPAGRKRQQGAGLLVLAAALVLGVATILVVRVNEIGTRSIADHRKHNAAVLEHAKKALIGYVALSAVQADEDNPGRLPCPESPNAPGTANEGTAASSCAPASVQKTIGRLPWKTLGLDKLLDAKAEPLWYAVSPGWVYASTTLVINSNSLSQLTVDGEANTVVALIIAPDVAMNVEASAGCTAHNQTRGVPAAGINPLNYVECFNSATLTSFATSGPSGSFNDQAVKITLADLMPAIEAAIAVRIERQIAPVLKAIYTPGAWGFGGTEPVYPFPAPFGDPSISAMQGAAPNTPGLLPLSYAETSPGSGVACAPGPSDPRCAPSFVAWTGTPTMTGGTNPSCTATATEITCNYYRTCLIICLTAGTTNFTLTATATNVGMAMRRLNSAAPMTNVSSVTNLSAVLNSSGSATMTLVGSATQQTGAGLGGALGALLCGVLNFLEVCKQETFSVPILVFADHSFLNSTTIGTGATGWYLRNRWHEVSYYAVASGYTPAGLGTPSCATGASCLSVANVAPSGAQRAILILAGRSINGTARPSGTLANYLEFGNASAAFERQPVSTAATPTLKNPFNDRIVVVDSN
jgi:hypothetical protein